MDIVTRLKTQTWSGFQLLAAEAALEIERLRTECDALKDDAQFKASKDRENEVVNANIMRAFQQSRDEAIAKLDGALTRIALLERALNAMLTHMGADEDEWNKPTFEQARSALGEKT
jgi:hypothetical protein